MTFTNTGRAALRRRLVEVLTEAFAATDDLTGVVVSYVQPGDLAKKDTVWFTTVTGTQEPTAFANRRTPRKDSFTISAELRSGNERTRELADQRCEAVFAVIEDALQSGDRLGVPWSSVPIHVSGIDGPNPIQGTDTAQSRMTFDISFNAPIR